jgi:hypothetical protein
VCWILSITSRLYGQPAATGQLPQHPVQTWCLLGYHHSASWKHHMDPLTALWRLLVLPWDAYPNWVGLSFDSINVPKLFPHWVGLSSASMTVPKPFPSWVGLSFASFNVPKPFLTWVDLAIACVTVSRCEESAASISCSSMSSYPREIRASEGFEVESYHIISLGGWRNVIPIY